MSPNIMITQLEDGEPEFKVSYFRSFALSPSTRYSDRVQRTGINL